MPQIPITILQAMRDALSVRGTVTLRNTVTLRSIPLTIEVGPTPKIWGIQDSNSKRQPGGTNEWSADRWSGNYVNICHLVSTPWYIVVRNIQCEFSLLIVA